MNLNFKIPKISRRDMVALIVLAAFLVIVTIPVYLPKNGCEVARANYECASVKDVMIENCEYWAQYDCNTEADNSLTQIVWYIENLCELQNRYHGSGLDCANLMRACNDITGRQACSFGTFG